MARTPAKTLRREQTVRVLAAQATPMAPAANGDARWRVPSASSGGSYVVRVSADGGVGCSCRGYSTWGHCLHAAAVARRLASGC